MKITRNKQSATAGASGVGAYAAPQRATATKSGAAAKPAADVTCVLGIPEAEFTPRVRDAIMSLMAEVERLRLDLERTKARLDTAEAMADRDGLLPVLNRRAFVRELSRAISYGERYAAPAALIYFDLDGFKAINDAFGHAAGDAALAHVGNLLTANVRESDIVGRLGGDEFGVILAKAGHGDAEKKARALVELLAANPFKWEGKPLAVSFAFGVYTFKKGDNADAAMASADKAMYAAKRAR
jgi:diguanylate cyclase (GGDEF)-like protein